MPRWSHTLTSTTYVDAFGHATANLKLGTPAATGVVMPTLLVGGSVVSLWLLRQEEE